VLTVEKWTVQMNMLVKSIHYTILTLFLYLCYTHLESKQLNAIIML